jgi:hypothetical protein
MVIAYLMQKHNWSLQKTLEMVQVLTQDPFKIFIMIKTKGS